MTMSTPSGPRRGRDIPIETDGMPPLPHTSGNGPEMSAVTPAEDARTIMINRISWSAVLAGVAIAIIAQVLLNMIGVGIGASALNPDGGSADATSVSAGAAVWWAVSGIIAAYIGGVAAGRLSGKPDSNTAGWHGLTTWAVTTLAMLWLLTTAVSSVVGGSLQMLGPISTTATQSLSQTAGAAAGTVDPLAGLETEIRANTGDRSAQVTQAANAIRALIVSPADQADQQRQEAVTALARAQNIPQDQAQTQVQQYEQEYQQLVRQGQQSVSGAAETAASAISWTTILGAIALALGALAGWLGGASGTVRPTVTSLLRRREVS